MSSSETSTKRIESQNLSGLSGNENALSRLAYEDLPAKPWQYGKPERIDGKCKVLDLPLNLLYKSLL